MRVLVHDVDLRQVVALAGFEIVWIMGRRYFHCAGAELGLREFIDDDGDLAIHQRQQNFLPVEMRVALVFCIHGDSGIAEHGFGARGRHRDEFIGSDDGIANLPEFSGDIFVLHFEIGDGGLAARAPVDDIFAAINQAFFVEADENFAHSAGKIFVHGEIFAIPIDGCAEALHLVEDGAAVELLPLPHALDKFFAAQVAALLAFFGEIALDHHLRGDAGMVGAGQPQGDETAHAMPADDDIHLRLVEHVAHVQAAGNVGRRQ